MDILPRKQGKTIGARRRATFVRAGNTPNQAGIVPNGARWVQSAAMPRTPRSTTLASLIILFAAAVLRLAALSRIPPGLPFEEASLAGTALHPPAFLSPGAGSQLMTWLMAGSLAAFGSNLLGIRMAAALSGLLTVVFTYRWASLVYSRRAGLIAAGLVAVSFWPIYFSRIGLGAATLPPIVALASWLLARGLKTGRWIELGAAGLVSGAALYSPPGGWLVPVIFLLVYVYLALARRDLLRASPSGHAALWIGAILAGLPLVIAQAGVIITPQMSALGAALGKSDSGPLLDGLGRGLAMWAALGDGLFHYNVGHWPVFNVGLATVFVVGIFYPAREPGEVGTREWRPAARMLAPAWLAAGVVAAALIDPSQPFTTGIIALPATYVTLALGLELIGRLASASRLDWPARRWGVIMAAVVLLAGVEGAWSYFVVAPRDPLAQGDYRTDLFRLAQALRAQPSGGEVAISANPPDNVPPLIFEFLPHGERPIRWFDGSTGVLVPASASEVDIPDMVPVRAELLAYLGRPVTSVPGIWRYETSTGQVRARIAAGGQEVTFGDILTLLERQSDTSRQAGKPIEVTLVWAVKRDAGASPDLAMFAHLLRPDGSLAAQSDELVAPSASWRSGDLLIQAEDILTKKVKPGTYQLEVGVYERANGQRLAVMVDGQASGDRLLLPPVKVVAP